MRALSTLFLALSVLTACDTVELEDAEIPPGRVWLQGEYRGTASADGRLFRHVFDLRGNPYDGSVLGTLTLDISGDQEWTFDVQGTQLGSEVDLFIGAGVFPGFDPLHFSGTMDSTGRSVEGEVVWYPETGFDYSDYSLSITKREATTNR